MDIWQQLTDFTWTTSSAAWIGLLTLVALEIVLGVDNIVFISILTGKLPEERRASARRKGLGAQAPESPIRRTCHCVRRRRTIRWRIFRGRKPLAFEAR